MKAVAVIIFVFFLFRLFCIFLRFHRHPIPYYLAALALLRHRRRIDHMMNHDHFNDGRHEMKQEGVVADVMETLPVLRYADVRKLMEKKVVRETGACAICLCEFEAGRSLLRLLPKCDHVFHVGCIDRWLAFHVTCPVCRAELTADSGDGDKFER
ncbi:unnamed protein product [Linum trigynum]|uniref:RING-type E3 ubiquitin transferase n=1 Tax=Linum trigynum TaxID=586398 RepID=A0AAV2DVN2_9ROSI